MAELVYHNGPISKSPGYRAMVAAFNPNHLDAYAMIAGAPSTGPKFTIEKFLSVLMKGLGSIDCSRVINFYKNLSDRLVCESVEVDYNKDGQPVFLLGGTTFPNVKARILSGF